MLRYVCIYLYNHVTGAALVDQRTIAGPGLEGREGRVLDAVRRLASGTDPISKEAAFTTLLQMIQTILVCDDDCPSDT